MKNKLVMIGTALAASAMIASANIAINWGTIDGPVFDSDGSTPVANGSIAQLIWSPTGVVPTSNLDINELDPLSMFFPDEVLIATGIAQDGIGFIPTAVRNALGQPGLVGGYVYTRSFNSAAPTIGDYFGVSGPIGGPLTDQSVIGASPDQLDAASITGFEIVPEPSVLAFLGIAGMMIALRRNRK